RRLRPWLASASTSRLPSAGASQPTRRRACRADSRSPATGLGRARGGAAPAALPRVGLGGVPAAARRLDRAAETRAGGHAELAAGPGPAALRRLPGLPRVRPAADPPPAPAPGEGARRTADPGPGGQRGGGRTGA